MALECVQRIPVIVTAAPAEVHVILVGVAVIAIDIEGMATATGAYGAKYDRPLGIHFLLQYRCPLSIVIEGRAVAIGAGLIDKAGSFRIITADQEGIADVAHTVHAHAAAACRAGTVDHALGMADVVHQRCHGSTLLSSIAAGVVIEHIVPVKGDRGHG